MNASKHNAKKEIEEGTKERLYDVMDDVLAASKDPDNHPAFEQLRNHLSDNQKNKESETQLKK